MKSALSNQGGKMVENEVYKLLGKMTEEMYLGLAKMQSSDMQDQLVAYHDLVEQKIDELICNISKDSAGELMQEQKRKIQMLSNDFTSLKNDITSKYKIYLRGCGNAGKSTLLNALLCLNENTGSRMGRIPMTFTIDTYTDELNQDKAEVRKIDSKGTGRNIQVHRSKAHEMETEEEREFRKSKDKCAELIASRVKNVYLEQEREDIETDIYKQHLMKTTIREIRWGIGINKFFHNCVLIDTPGLSQELRFTNVIEDIKNYEVDGIIWLISSDTLAKEEVIEAYKKEMKEMEWVYKDKKVIAVVNMYGAGDEYKYGSKLWRKVEKRAHMIYCQQYGFSEIICVNAKLAYDGNLFQNQKQIDDSNISALRKKINEMFVEKSSEEYHQTKLKKIESFLDNFYKDLKGQSLELQEKVAQYDDIKAKIISQESACKMLVQEEKDKIVTRHLATIKNRLEANANQVNNLDNATDSSRNYFIEHTIIGVGELEKNIYTALDRCEDSIFNRFKEQQIQSVISDFRTKEYALQNFQKTVGNISIKKNRHAITISPPKGIGAGAFHIVKEIFGRDSFLTGIVKGIRDSIKSPQNRVFEEIRSDIINWVSSIELFEEINEYAQQCYVTLEKSMETTCGNYDDIKKICEFIKEFLGNKPQMKWENTGLSDILGGAGDV